MEKKSRELLAPHVEEELMDYILHTPVKIGEKLPNEFELAELFGVGRSTVRETVKSLVSKGVLEVRRGSGTAAAAATGTSCAGSACCGRRSNWTRTSST